MGRRDTIRDSRRIRRMFGGIAGSYDLLNHLLSFNQDRGWRRKAAGGLTADGPVLDVCAGTGDMALEWASSGKNAVFASDFCREMVEICADKASEADTNSGVHSLVADTLDLPFAEGAFGCVSVAFGIRNVTDLDAGIREMARVARPGGEVRILEFTMPGNLLFRALYLFYFLFVLPILGNLVSGTGDSAYGYLPRSVLNFPNAARLSGMLAAAGLTEVRTENLSMGIVNVLIGTKGLSENRFAGQRAQIRPSR